MPIEALHHIFEEVTYCVDNLKVRGLIMTPKEDVKRIVIYLRGGKGQVGKVRAGSEGKDEFYGADLNDVTVAIRLLHQKYPYAAIHMVGFSRGGLQGLLTFQDLPISSYIIWGGVSDIYLMYEERVDLRGMLKRMIGHPKKQAVAYQQRDALAQITKSSPPIFIVHGGKDKQVGIHHAYYLAQQLEEKGTTYRTFYQMLEGHVPRPFALKQTLCEIKQWMIDVEENKIE